MKFKVYFSLSLSADFKLRWILFALRFLYILFMKMLTSNGKCMLFSVEQAREKAKWKIENIFAFS